MKANGRAAPIAVNCQLYADSVLGQDFMAAPRR
jgi:hypothetical protein